MIQVRAIKSIVVVGLYGDGDYYIDFVAKVDYTSIFLVTQSNFVGGRKDRLKVCFLPIIATIFIGLKCMAIVHTKNRLLSVV